ncbi:hypothetical protein AGABI1DRAFT_111913 [Agaricus bisporus var. burnettii JB137-S8]|uniref:Uncharacterized protein n=1 Tax=Agaricus bisporus var. burnettii (strain JB137-S8 / ATCC MYA-4627 / FGSC 10392) TaxID=597362 RepID=K5Y1G4_AGABU|nr:uncharacterized protein AGABI1DRAFT_111913 [Agaricus bisporus var. burnettii JB137-S8]EKM81635.1 hypothetical protein AGABI1DRAFT_111913 [Agaricus bisporus var. burnettii JB137-S8]
MPIVIKLTAMWVKFVKASRNFKFGVSERCIGFTVFSSSLLLFISPLFSTDPEFAKAKVQVQSS